MFSGVHNGDFLKNILKDVEAMINTGILFSKLIIANSVLCGSCTFRA